MSAAPLVSVVVASRGRSLHLRRCITALGQQFYHPFEIVVVADAGGASALSEHPLHDRLKISIFDEANISKARNIGLQSSAGTIAAFIDDDACAEPTWLERLIAPLHKASAVAATGHVLGRNGISLQWGTRYLDREGFHHTTAGPGRVGKLEGTNMAVRTDVLRGMGGFDERFRFFHDDADLSMRLARAGHEVVAVPLAVVHHGYAASHLRQTNRTPISLQEIGRSTSVFQATHGDPGARTQTLSDRRSEERRRMIEHMICGRAEPRDVRRRLAEFDAGLNMPVERPMLGGLDWDGSEFAPFRDRPPQRVHKVLSGRSWQRSSLLKAAAKAADDGAVASVFCLSATSLYHRVHFTEDGVWLQIGGVFGRSTRKQPLFRPCNLKSRVAEEAERIRQFRT